MKINKSNSQILMMIWNMKEKSKNSHTINIFLMEKKTKILIHLILLKKTKKSLNLEILQWELHHLINIFQKLINNTLRIKNFLKIYKKYKQTKTNTFKPETKLITFMNILRKIREKLQIDFILNFSNNINIVMK